jgi:site-specific recombinase XerD
MKRYRRLGNRPPGSADTVSNATILERPIANFLAHQASRNLSPYTLRNQSTFASLTPFCAAKGLDPDLEALPTGFFRHYQGGLLAGPLPVPRHGQTERQAGTVAARIRQLRAFCRWLEEEGRIARPVRFNLPKGPACDIATLTDAQVAAIFRSRHLAGDSTPAKRNRALISLLLDSGLRLAEIAGGGYWPSR